MFFVVLLLLLTRYPVFGANNSCQLFLRAEENSLLGKNWEPLGPAKLFSTPVMIPAFQLRFIDSKTKKGIAPSKISIAYGWKWLEYPYPEHSWGAWSGASDIFECIEPSIELSVSEFEVNPRGWYDGKYVKFPFIGKQPSFTGISIVMYDVGCSITRAKISQKEISKLKGNKTVIIEVNCTGNSIITIE